jgi:FkbM family methyltransferase
MNNMIYKLTHVFPILRERTARYLNMPLYASIQYETESNFHEYIKSKPEQIKNIIVVGAYLGLEFPRLLKNYPNVHIYAFEPNPSYYAELEKKFKSNSSVHLMNIAVSASEGTAIFNDGSKPGTGSLLELSSFAIEAYGVESVGIHEVETSSLDKLFSNSISPSCSIALSWSTWMKDFWFSVVQKLVDSLIEKKHPTTGNSTAQGSSDSFLSFI